MSRTFVRQFTQIRESDNYLDNLAMSGAETAATNLEDDLNFIRTQLRILNGQTKWYDPPANGFNLKEIHDKPLWYVVQKYDDVAVPASQNYVVLSGAEKPDYNIAIAPSSLGTIVAQLTGSVGSHSILVSTNNGNVSYIRDATTNLPIFTHDGYQIYGLLQVGNLATDDNPFSDAGNDRGQISFVYLNPVTEVFAAVDVADIENRIIEYAYKRRVTFYALPENAYDTVFSTSGSGGGSSNLKKATKVISGTITADTPIDISTFTNPDSMIFGIDGAGWVKNYEVYLNGMVLLSGENSSSNNDVYYISNTQFAFEFDLENNDIVQIIQRKT